MGLSAFLRLLRRQLVLVIAATLIGVSIGALTAMLTPQRYESATDVYLSVRVGADAAPSERSQATSYAQQVVESYRSVIASSLVLAPVIESLGLDVTPAQLAEAVRTSTAAGSVVITIAVGDENPGQSARIANAVADAFADAVANTLEKRETAASYSVQVLQVQQAQVPTEPVVPNLRLSLILGALAGLGAGIGIAVLRTSLDTRIRTTQDLEQSTGLPVLGGIPHDPRAAERPLVIAAEPTQPPAEAFRALRTNVRFLVPAGETGSFVVTSAGPAEGKTTVTANLAIAFAEAGHRVVLIDADLRLPRIAEHFGIEGGVGLSDVLAGRIAVNDVLQRWGRGTLFLLPAGTVPPNPAELLGSPAMASLIRDLSAVFGIVIIDAPPVVLVTDAAVVSRFTTGALMVAAAGTTTQPKLADAVAKIEAAGSRVLGAVLTMLPTRGADKGTSGTYAAERAKTPV